MGNTFSSKVPGFAPHEGPIDLSRPLMVGVGGKAMSGIARLLARSGSEVSGTDIADSPQLQSLRELGCTIRIGHDVSALTDSTSCVIYTRVAAQAPEVSAALKRGIPTVHRLQAVAEAFRGRTMLAVTGTHGKSTTTAMLGTALDRLGEDPTYLVGADLDEPGSGVHVGQGPFVVEADEADRGFHLLSPEVVVITNIHHDHPENYRGLDDTISSFAEFVTGMKPDGILVVDLDERPVLTLLDEVTERRPDIKVHTFGTKRGTVRIESIERAGASCTARVLAPCGARVAITLDTPSIHQARDAVAALTALIATGHDPAAAATAISAFRGVRRRCEILGTAGGVTVIDSYADHPGEIAADLDAARELAGAGSVIAVVEPAGAGRVNAFHADYGRVLARGADRAIVLPLDAAAGTKDRAYELISEAVLDHEGSVFCAPRSGVVATATMLSKPGDVVVVMGLGDIVGAAEQILAELNAVAA